MQLNANQQATELVNIMALLVERDERAVFGPAVT
jgi:hypothetical protein